MKKMCLVIGLVLALACGVWAQDMSTPVRMDMSSSAKLQDGIRGSVGAHNVYRIECIRDGKVIWTEDINNIVTGAGLNYLLNAGFEGTGNVNASWYIGLIAGTSGGVPTGTDTMGTHSWSEMTVAGWSTVGLTHRGILTLGSSASSGSVVATATAFTMQGTTTINGAFVCSDGTSNGTAGTLYGAGLFTTPRSVVLGDVLNVTITLTVTATDAGDYLYEFLDQRAVLFPTSKEAFLRELRG
jgi:hypothetical protein